MNEKEFYMEQQRAQCEEFLLEKVKFEETLKLELQRREEYITENSVFERRSKQLIKDLDEATTLTQK